MPVYLIIHWGLKISPNTIFINTIDRIDFREYYREKKICQKICSEHKNSDVKINETSEATCATTMLRNIGWPFTNSTI